MSELRFESYTMPAASMGCDNPLPPLQRLRVANEADPDSFAHIPEEDRKFLGWGIHSPILPYQLQDGYHREREPRAFRTAVLENEQLRATFLLELGGRLWSLVHKPSGRELLYSNPVFQPANLATRNAWFSGGVEWNASVHGHTPLTCSPLFAARLAHDDGTPVLRMWEWDRVRGVPFQIDAYLPDDSELLYVGVRLRNPHEAEIPTYWWSNIAVPENEGQRIIVPTDESYTHGYAGGMSLVSLPIVDGRDLSYPRNAPRAGDFFYRLPSDTRPFIAALEADGSGLVQTSTPRLKGRKLFLWGQGPGGRSWQDWLSEPGKPYIEIQAGLARTQNECLPFPGKASWTWLEAYGLLQAQPSLVHGDDWAAARSETRQKLDALLPEERLAAEERRSAALFARPPETIIQMGAGWGALERRRREAAGEAPLSDEGTPFPDDSLGPLQAPWLELLEHGALPEGDADDPPISWLVQPEWRKLLEASLEAGHSRHWLGRWQQGLMAFAAGDYDAAYAAWARSLELQHSAWALRCLGAMARQEGDLDRAAEMLQEAWEARPDEIRLVHEAGEVLLRSERPAEAMSLIERLKPELRETGRVQLLEARARLALGDLDGCQRMIEDGIVVTDLREGEDVLTDLWFGIQVRRVSQREGVPIDDELRKRVRREYPPPGAIDFRMSAKREE